MKNEHFRNAVVFHIGTLFSALSFISLIGLGMVALMQTYVVTLQYANALICQTG